MKLSNPVKKYYAKAMVVDSPYIPHNCSVIAMGNTKQELCVSKTQREHETGLGKLEWQLVDSEENIIEEIV